MKIIFEIIQIDNGWLLHNKIKNQTIFCETVIELIEILTELLRYDKPKTIASKE